MTFTDQLREQIRLAVLQCLEAASAYTLHEYLILERIRALGLGTTRDALRAEFAWLEETGLLTIEPVESAVIATLTARGADAARDYAHVPGVARPRP
jgi:DNA-binding GntR family transcriptional regulator